MASAANETHANDKNKTQQQKIKYNVNKKKQSTLFVLLLSMLVVACISSNNIVTQVEATVGLAALAGAAALGSLASGAGNSPIGAVIQAHEAGNAATEASNTATSGVSLATGNTIGTGIATYLGGLGGTLSNNLASVGGTAGNVISAVTGAPLALLSTLPQASNDIMNLYGRLTSPIAHTLQVSQAALTNPIITQTGATTAQITTSATNPIGGVVRTVGNAQAARVNNERAANHAQASEQYAQQAAMERQLGSPISAAFKERAAAQHALASRGAANRAQMNAGLSGGYGGSLFNAANANQYANQARNMYGASMGGPYGRY